MHLLNIGILIVALFTAQCSAFVCTRCHTRINTIVKPIKCIQAKKWDISTHLNVVASTDNAIAIPTASQKDNPWKQGALSIVSAISLLTLEQALLRRYSLASVLDHCTQYRSTQTMSLLIALFGTTHSSLAMARNPMEKMFGARIYRVIFAGLSLPLAIESLQYFLDHRFDGVQLWDIRDYKPIYAFATALSLVSLFLLNPYLYDLNELTATKVPRSMKDRIEAIYRKEQPIPLIHRYVSRHPQTVAQFLWGLSHAILMGTSFSLVTVTLLSVYTVIASVLSDWRLLQQTPQATMKYFRDTWFLPGIKWNPFLSKPSALNLHEVCDDSPKIAELTSLVIPFSSIFALSMLIWYAHDWNY